MLQQQLYEALAALEAGHTTTNNTDASFAAHVQCAGIIQDKVALTESQVEFKASLCCCHDANEKLKEQLQQERWNHRQKLHQALDEVQSLTVDLTICKVRYWKIL